MNGKNIVAGIFTVKGLTTIPYLMQKHKEGIGGVWFYPFILIITIIGAYLGFLLMNKRPKKDTSV